MCRTRCRTLDKWRIAKVISVFKKGDKTVISIYRGISLVSTTYKLHGKISNEILNSVSDILLLHEQIEFCKGHSWIDDILVENID